MFTSALFRRIKKILNNQRNLKHPFKCLVMAVFGEFLQLIHWSVVCNVTLLKGIIRSWLDHESAVSRRSMLQLQELSNELATSGWFLLSVSACLCIFVSCLSVPVSICLCLWFSLLTSSLAFFCFIILAWVEMAERKFPPGRRPWTSPWASQPLQLGKQSNFCSSWITQLVSVCHSRAKSTKIVMSRLKITIKITQQQKTVSSMQYEKSKHRIFSIAWLQF